MDRMLLLTHYVGPLHGFKFPPTFVCMYTTCRKSVNVGKVQ
jgi:hypothetical protein